LLPARIALKMAASSSPATRNATRRLLSITGYVMVMRTSGHVRQHQRNLALLCHRSLGFAQSSGRQERPSRVSSSSAAAGPLLPAA
jgi:hypothetical protein